MKIKNHRDINPNIFAFDMFDLWDLTDLTFVQRLSKAILFRISIIYAKTGYYFLRPSFF